MYQRNRILMAEADAGSTPAAAPAPAADVPQAQGAPTGLSKETADVIASAVAQAVSGMKDSIFAEARRTFTAQKPSKNTPAEAPASAPAAAQFDPIKLRALDRSLSKLGIASELSAKQYERAERDFVAEAPDDAESWAKEYFPGWKVAPAAPAAPAPVTQPAVTTQPQRNAAPVSDRGSPPVSAVPLEDQDLISMSPSDREALLKNKGSKWFTDKVLEQSRVRTFKLR